MKRIVTSTILAILIFFSSLIIVHGDEFQDVENEIDSLKQKIADTQTKERSLNTEISSKDNQIKLKTLEVADTAEKINRLGAEIETLNSKIEKLETTLSRMSEVLLTRIVTSYKINRVSYFPLLFAAEGVSDLLNRVKYIELAQTHDRQVMTDIQFTKLDFGEQKDLREKKRLEQELLQIELESQRLALDKEKRAKVVLLEQTKNDEATYQRLLQQALAERQALEAALITGQKVGPVKTGDPIAVVGNTGYPACSTGPHLHFEVRKNNQWVNPGDYLKSMSISNVQDPGNARAESIGSGSWNWPLEGDVLITQLYGQTPYSYRYKYSGEIHTGFDMYSNTSSVIRAPKDGTLFAAEQNCGGSSIIKIKYIEHDDGVVSFYLHVQ